jgi:hypothetical protein
VLRKRFFLGFARFSGYITGNNPGHDVWRANPSARQSARTRRRAAARGFVRVEAQAPKRDASLIRALAETLRGDAEKADALRSTLAKALTHPEVKTAFDIFGSELPDEAFAGVFEQPRRRNWREIDL